MKKLSLNQNWQYSHVGGEEMKRIDLPHDGMLAEERNQKNKSGVNGAYFAGFDYLYEHTLSIQKQPDTDYILEFEGVYRKAEVSLNGEQIAFRPYGYTNFYVDITDRVKDGDNLLSVVARNADQPNSRWYSGAGIYRPVWLYELPKEHILLNGIQVKTLDYKKGEIEVAVKTNAAGSVTVEILDGESVVLTEEKKTEGEIALKLIVPNAKLWSPERPCLYTCRVTFGKDVQDTKFGIRSVFCDAKSGLLINGERVILRGGCIHHDNGVLGACAYDYAEERKVKLLQKAGYNAIRSAHNPCSKALLEACDRLGMLVMDEYIDGWYIHKTKYDYADYIMEWWRQDLTDFVEKDFNHPSVVMYSIGNEVAETSQKQGIAFTEEMVEFLHRIDGTRPVSCGVNIFFNFLFSMGFGVYSDEKAEKTPDKETGSAFFNKLAGMFGDKTMKIGATLHGSDVKTRDAFAKMDVAGYNYGILRYKKDLKKYPDRVILGSETFCKDASQFYEMAKEHPAIIGDFVWAGMDYIGEVGIGSWEYKDHAKDFVNGCGWLTAGSGRVDLNGRELGEALYTKVSFDLLPIAIAVVPVDNAFEEHSPSAWKMSNAWESWSWNGHDGKKTFIEVFAAGYRVELYVNGNKVGSKKLKYRRAIFKAVYHTGTVEAVAYDKAGKELSRTSLRSAGEKTRLTLIPEEKTVNAEGGLVYVKLRYTDDAGVWKPLVRGKIKVAVEGGSLLGLGHACPYNEDGYLKDTTDTYFGEALAVVKPDGRGTVKLSAESAFGNATTEVTIL